MPPEVPFNVRVEAAIINAITNSVPITDVIALLQYYTAIERMHIPSFFSREAEQYMIDIFSVMPDIKTVVENFHMSLYAHMYAVGIFKKDVTEYVDAAISIIADATPAAALPIYGISNSGSIWKKIIPFSQSTKNTYGIKLLYLQRVYTPKIIQLLKAKNV